MQFNETRGLEETLQPIHLYSTQVSKPYITIQDYISKLKPRIHKDAVLADLASFACQEDWARSGREGHLGNLNMISGNGGALAFAECLPERLFIVAYVYEFFFLYDSESPIIQP